MFVGILVCRVYRLYFSGFLMEDIVFKIKQTKRYKNRMVNVPEIYNDNDLFCWHVGVA